LGEKQAIYATICDIDSHLNNIFAHFMGALCGRKMSAEHGEVCRVPHIVLAKNVGRRQQKGFAKAAIQGCALWNEAIEAKITKIDVKLGLWVRGQKPFAKPAMRVAVFCNFFGNTRNRHTRVDQRIALVLRFAHQK